MRIEEVKKNLNRRCSWNGSDCYILTGCIIRVDKKTGRFFYQAELSDITTNNSIIITRLEEVTICQKQ
jgi:hypothetical protein